MILRSASLAAGLSLAAAVALVLPLSAQAGMAGHGWAAAHASAHASVAAHASASAYSHAGGAYMVHTAYSPAYGGYGHQGHYAMGATRYPAYYPTHYPSRYPAQGGYAYNNNRDYHHDYDRHDYDHRDYDRRRYDHRGYGGNSYALIYSPTYADSGYAGDYSGGYAYAGPAEGYADYGGDYASPAPDYSYDDDYVYAQPYDSGYADTRYNTVTYDDAAYAPPAPEPDYAPIPSCACSQPVLDSSANAYGWRDSYGNWHVTSQTSRYSYSYSY